MAAKKKKAAAKKKVAAPAKKKVAARAKPKVAAPAKPKVAAPAKPKVAAPAKPKAAAKTPNTPAVFAPLFAKIDAIDWVVVSNDSDGATFPKDLRAFLGAKTPELRTQALDTIWKKEVNAPIGALATRFLMELLAQPNDVGDLPAVLRLLVGMITSDHTRCLEAPFAAEQAGFMFSRLNKWSAIAERRDLVFALLVHESEAIRAHAAFLLAWLGRAYSETIVPELLKATHDVSALVRASALLAVGLHGEPVRFADHANDPDARVRLAAALASSFVPLVGFDENALDCILVAVETPITWPELPWSRGDLGSLSIKRLLALPSTFDERTRPHLVKNLDGPLAEVIIVDLLQRAFPNGVLLDGLTDPQRDTLALVLANAKTHTAAVTELAQLGAPLGNYNQVRSKIDLLRRAAGLSRTAPTSGTRAKVTFEGTTKYAQHWIADWAETGEPADGPALARAIIDAVPLGELVDLLVAIGDVEPDAYDASVEVTFEHPLPEGGTKHDAIRYTFPHDGWPDRARAYFDVLRRDGFHVESEWWYLTSVRGVAHRDGRVLSFELGNDWNQGNPIMTESQLRLYRHRFSLGRILPGAALLHKPGFEEELVRRVQDAVARKSDQSIDHRVAMLAIRAYGPTARVPPPALDEAAVFMQTYWTYVQGPFRVYAGMLDETRREELVLRVLTESQHRVVELYGITPTPAVLERVVEEARSQLKSWAKSESTLTERWRMSMGAETDSVIAAARA